MDEQAGEVVALRRKVLRRFYEPLLLLNALGQIRGERIKPELNSDTAASNHQKTRRAFADGIAYICAHERGPDCVTATALETSPDGIIVWLAANSSIKPEVETFLREILDDLTLIAEQSTATERHQRGEEMYETLVARIITFNRAKLSSYYIIMKGYTVDCLPCIQQTDPLTHREPELSELENWLRFPYTTNCSLLGDGDLQNIVRQCHEKRNSLLKLLIPYTAQGQTRWHKFEQLYKLLLKLGKHVTIARKLIDAAVTLPQDINQGFIVKTVPSSKPQKLPLLPKEGTVESTLGRMFSDEEQKNRFLARLESVWDTKEISTLSKKELTTKTVVHAELLLINHFDMHGGTFLGGSDKYIGCSKAACYLCYNFIRNHPGRYAIPSTHQKIYIKWRMPDIYPNENSSHKRYMAQDVILEKMIKSIRQELQTEIESREPRRPFHADSTAGVTSTVDSFHVNLVSRLGSLTVNETHTSTLGEGQHTAHDFHSEGFGSYVSDDSDDGGGVPLS